MPFFVIHSHVFLDFQTQIRVDEPLKSASVDSGGLGFR